MPLRKLGSHGPEVGSVGLGCMGMSAFYGGGDDQESVAAIHRAVDLGVTMLDTADMYGPWTNEQLIGRALHGRRDRVTIATKFGQEVDDNGVWTKQMNGRPEYVRKTVEGSLRRLGIEEIDLYYQHRVDPDVPVEETFGALSELVQAGKVKHLGISEAAPRTIRRAHAVAPLTAVQTEYSLFSRDVESNGVLDICGELGIGFVAYAPLGRGVLTGKLDRPELLSSDDVRRDSPRFAAQNLESNLRIVKVLASIADEKSVTVTQLALAWALARSESLVVIPGTRRIKHIEENAAAGHVTLSPSDLDRINQVAPPGAAAGARYDAGGLARVHL